MALALSQKKITEAVILPVTLEWTIKDFQALCHEDEPPLKSPVYSSDGIDFQLEVNYFRQKGETRMFFSVKFCLVSCKYTLPLRAHHYTFIVQKGNDVYSKFSTKHWVLLEKKQTYVGQVWPIDFRSRYDGKDKQEHDEDKRLQVVSRHSLHSKEDGPQ